MNYESHHSRDNNFTCAPTSSNPVPFVHFSGQKRSASPSSGATRNKRGVNRSVNDYNNEKELREALSSFDVYLQDPECHSILREIAEGESVQKAARVGEKDAAGDEVVSHMDWVLPKFDAATTESQSMSHEVQRLQVLRKYLVLDSEREQAFERITALASRIFDVPIALVSLVDLGRQWFMSNRGLGDVRETPRKMAFCSRKFLHIHSALAVTTVSKTHVNYLFLCIIYLLKQTPS